MQIITTQQIIQMVIDSRHYTSELFGLVINGVGENIYHFGIATWADITSGNILSINLYMFSMSIIVAYRIVRKNIFKSISHLLNTHGF